MPDFHNTDDYMPPHQSYWPQNHEVTGAVDPADNALAANTAPTLPTLPTATTAVPARATHPHWGRIALVLGIIAFVVAGSVGGVLFVTHPQSTAPCAAPCGSRGAIAATATPSPTTATIASATPTHAATTAPTQPAAATLPFTCGTAQFGPYQAAGTPFPATLPGNPQVMASGTLDSNALTLTYDACIANDTAATWQNSLQQSLQSGGWVVANTDVVGKPCPIICATQRSGPTAQDTTLHIDVAALQTQGSGLAAIIRFSIPASYASSMAFSQPNTTMSATPGTLADLIAQGQDRVFTGQRTTILVLPTSAAPTACGLRAGATFMSYPSSGQPLTVPQATATCLKASSGSLALVQFDYTGGFQRSGGTPNTPGSIQWWVFPLGFSTTQG